jgi:hypothetical protein
MDPKKIQELFRRYKGGLCPESIVNLFKIDKWEEVGSWGWHVVRPEDMPRTPQKPPADKFLRLVKDK